MPMYLNSVAAKLPETTGAKNVSCSTAGSNLSERLGYLHLLKMVILGKPIRGSRIPPLNPYAFLYIETLRNSFKVNKRSFILVS